MYLGGKSGLAIKEGSTGVALITTDRDGIIKVLADTIAGTEQSNRASKENATISPPLLL